MALGGDVGELRHVLAREVVVRRARPESVRGRLRAHAVVEHLRAERAAHCGCRTLGVGGSRAECSNAEAARAGVARAGVVGAGG
eukprot:6749486-Prymnesium_polylepis.1